MRSWWVTCLVMGSLGQAAAAEPVSLTFDWPDGEARRVVTTWRVDVLPPDGKRASADGTVREEWRMDREPTGWVLSNPRRQLVRAGESLDTLTAEIARGFDVAWQVVFTPDGAVPRDPDAPSDGSSGADDAPLMMPDSPDGASITTETVVTTGDEPAEAVAGTTGEEAVATNVLSAAEVRALIHGDREAMLERLFGTFHGQSMTPGVDQAANAGLVSPGTGEVDQAAVVRRLTALPFCPDRGPGTVCVELELVRAYDGADTRSSMLDAGQRRVVERWVVEPDSLVPHSAEITEQVARSDAEGARWTYTASRSMVFLPMDPPAPPEAAKAM